MLSSHDGEVVITSVVSNSKTRRRIDSSLPDSVPGVLTPMVLLRDLSGHELGNVVVDAGATPRDLRKAVAAKIPLDSDIKVRLIVGTCDLSTQRNRAALIDIGIEHGVCVVVIQASSPTVLTRAFWDALGFGLAWGKLANTLQDAIETFSEHFNEAAVQKKLIEHINEEWSAALQEIPTFIRFYAGSGTLRWLMYHDIEILSKSQAAWEQQMALEDA